MLENNNASKEFIKIIKNLNKEDNVIRNQPHPNHPVQTTSEAWTSTGIPIAVSTDDLQKMLNTFSKHPKN